MNTSSLQTPQGTYRQITVNTVVVGSGAAGFNAADRLWMLGQHDVAIVTEHVKAGTSRNTGSDKQTYYKLTLSGGDPDSVREMAETLFSGECVDGAVRAGLPAPCGAGRSVPEKSIWGICGLQNRPRSAPQSNQRRPVHLQEDDGGAGEIGQ